MKRAPHDDFVPLTTNSPATEAWAPLYSRSDSNSFYLGTFIRPLMCNSRSMAHGGVIAALADYAMGHAYAVSRRALHGDFHGGLTSQLVIDYIGIAALGTWLQFNPRVVHAAEKRGVVDTLIFADGDLVARANAVFRHVS